MPEINVTHVAVAVVQNSEGKYLIAKRPQDSHQGGLWEFPGGKIENNESVFDALKREIFEEVGITIEQATPLIKIHHDYGDKSVLLDVWCVDRFSEEAFGKEGQEIRFIKQNEFSLYNFPAANMSLIDAIQLPDKYMITGKFNNEEELLKRIRASIGNGIQLIQFRSPQLEENTYFEYAKKMYALCEKENIKLLLNTSVDKYKKYSAVSYSHGLHLNSKELKFYSPMDFVEKKLLISTSTHDKKELLLAEEKKVNFIVLSPVNKTSSHPDSIPLGWGKFKQLVEFAKVPVYALGGMTVESLQIAKNNGGQGIAAIGEFWNEK